METIADLPLEERHAIVRRWLEDLTTIYEQCVAERAALQQELRQQRHEWHVMRAALEDILTGAARQSQSHADVIAKCRSVL